jgi:hypothetical protein
MMDELIELVVALGNHDEGDQAMRMREKAQPRRVKDCLWDNGSAHLAAEKSGVKSAWLKHRVAHI